MITSHFFSLERFTGAYVKGKRSVVTAQIPAVMEFEA
jgi:hypothetical protein